MGRRECLSEVSTQELEKGGPDVQSYSLLLNLARSAAIIRAGVLTTIAHASAIARTRLSELLLFA